MSKQINDFIRQTYQYFYIDGLPELASGSMYLVTGILLAVMTRVESGTLAAGLVGLALIPIILGGIYLQNRLLRHLKERITYLRSGYVSYRRERKDSRRWIVIVVALLLPFVLTLLPEQWQDLPLVIGGILGSVHIYMGYRLSIKRFYIEGAFAVFLGIVAAIFLNNEVLGAAIIFLGAGIVLMAAGGLTLRHYLQTHPLADEVTG